MKETTVKYHLVFLNKFFSYLVDHEYVTRNPVTAVMKAVGPYKPLQHQRKKLIKTGAYNKDEKALFINRGGRMTPEALGQAVAKVAVVAGFREPGGEGAKANGFHAHDMRYAFGNWLADASMPKEMIIKLRGGSGGTTFDDVYREIDTRVLKEEYLSRMPRLGIA